jgi:hypothetical protein
MHNTILDLQHILNIPTNPTLLHIPETKHIHIKSIWDLCIYLYGLANRNSSFQENVPNDVAEPAASRTCIFSSPFLRESGEDGVSLPDARNFVA